eukprot:TRINITY_DN127_c2_g1_i3.p1 TRINITY_DN127_c2_g1~~TRINITY_DN127_c2_g1_i3.p1  ORF type:complete len:122 (+),score=21.68 TRINITY_DN127_c2_g1_i3:76-441(+)
MAEKAGPCARCKKEIEGANFALTAFDKTYHKECFTCIRCKERVFSFAKFFEENNEPLCAKCNKTKLPTCKACNKLIEGTFVDAQGFNWHHKCFKCQGCGKVFGEEGYFEDEGQLWHLECYK